MRCVHHPDKDMSLSFFPNQDTFVDMIFRCPVCGEQVFRVRNYELLPGDRKLPPKEYEEARSREYPNTSAGLRGIPDPRTPEAKERDAGLVREQNPQARLRLPDYHLMTREEFLSRCAGGDKAVEILSRETEGGDKSSRRWARRVIARAEAEHKACILHAVSYERITKGEAIERFGDVYGEDLISLIKAVTVTPPGMRRNYI